jgi:hypothetical protein
MPSPEDTKRDATLVFFGIYTCVEFIDIDRFLAEERGCAF